MLSLLWGGGWVFWKKRFSKVEVLNDTNKDLINLYKIVKYHPDEFVKQFDFELISRFVFDNIKKQNIDNLTDIQKAARFYYLQSLSFGGKNTDQRFGVFIDRKFRLNLNELKSEILNYHKRLSEATIECLDYKEVIAKYDRDFTFFYLDPPYLGTQDYYTGNLFENSEYYALAEILKNIKGNFILSINDTPKTREIYKDFQIKEVKTTYSLYPDNNKEITELLIKNFEDEISLLKNW